MNLLEYLEKFQISKAEFASRIKVSRQYLYFITEGQRKPSKKIAERIKKASNGLINVQKMRFPIEHEYINEKKTKKDKKTNYSLKEILRRVEDLEEWKNKKEASNNISSSPLNDIHHNNEKVEIKNINLTQKGYLP